MLPQSTRRTKPGKSEIYKLYCSQLTTEVIDEKKTSVEPSVKCRNRLFPIRLVLCLMIFQRLSPKHTLNAALQEVLLGKPKELLSHLNWVRSPELSSSTAAYSKARSRISVDLLKALVEHLIHRIIEHFSRWSKWHNRRVFLVDGTTIRLQHTKEIIKEFGLPKNHLGEGYWPIMLVVLVHDLITGIALPPAFGASQYNLGVMYNNGQGVTRSYIQAHKWYNIAASNDADNKAAAELAAKARDNLAAKMNQTQIEEAQRLAKQFKPRVTKPTSNQRKY